MQTSTPNTRQLQIAYAEPASTTKSTITKALTKTTIAMANVNDKLSIVPKKAIQYRSNNKNIRLLERLQLNSRVPRTGFQSNSVLQPDGVRLPPDCYDPGPNINKINGEIYPLTLPIDEKRFWEKITAPAHNYGRTTKSPYSFIFLTSE